MTRPLDMEEESSICEVTPTLDLAPKTGAALLAGWQPELVALLSGAPVVVPSQSIYARVGQPATIDSRPDKPKAHLWRGCPPET